MIWNLRDLFENDTQREIEQGVWVPARPIGSTFRGRLRAAWMVLTGRADAVVWPGQ